MGHNTDNICRWYNSDDGCKRESRECHFLHIKMKKPKKEEDKEREAGQGRETRFGRENRNTNRGEGDKRTNGRGQKERAAEGRSENNRRWEREHARRQREVNDSEDEGKKKFERPKKGNENQQNHETARKKRTDQKAKTQQIEEARNGNPDEDVSLRHHFLRMGRKHDVWKESAQKRVKMGKWSKRN